jgi:hypothetical protein
MGGSGTSQGRKTVAGQSSNLRTSLPKFRRLSNVGVGKQPSNSIQSCKTRLVIFTQSATETVFCFADK